MGFSSINWDKIDKKLAVHCFNEIAPSVEKLMGNTVDKMVYVLWNDASLPIIRTDLDSVVNHFDDITCLGFETWFYNPEQGYIMEFAHNGEIMIGLVPASK